MRVMESLLGPHLGSRLGPGDVDDADTLDVRRLFHPFAALMFVGSGLLTNLAVVVCTLFADPLPGYRPAVIATAATLGMLAGLSIPLVWSQYPMRPIALHGFMLSAVGLVTLGSLGSGPDIAPYGGIFYICLSMVVGTVFERSAARLYYVVIAAAEAGVLRVIEPSTTPVARWILVSGACVVSGLAIDRLVGLLQGTARAEARAREEAEEARALLEIASSHKSEFLASMSHELRTPLNAIIGFSDVLLTRHFGDLTDDQSEYVDDIRSSGQHLLELINDVLDLSKVEAGRLEIDPQWFLLSETIDAAVTFVQPRADATGITLRTAMADPTLEVLADERRIKQVLVNLLANAVKFTPSGGTIEVAVERSGDEVLVAVNDTGVGIAPEDHDRIFDDFSQATGVHLANEGSGLGLALARRFLALHGGRIWVESAVGEGSTFAFALPWQPRTESVLVGEPTSAG